MCFGTDKLSLGIAHCSLLIWHWGSPLGPNARSNLYIGSRRTELRNPVLNSYSRSSSIDAMNRHRLSRLARLVLWAAAALTSPEIVPRARAHAELTIQIDEMTRQIAKDPRNVELYFRRGELHRTHLDWPAAQADFEQILAIDPGNKEVDYSLGRLMADSNWLLSAKGYLD